MRPVFVHEGRLPDMNSYTEDCRTSWALGAKTKRDTTDMIAWEMRAQNVPRYGNPVRIHFEWHEPKAGNNRYRDLDNISFARKCILDAMDRKHAFVIGDDDPMHVIELRDTIVLEPKGSPYLLKMFVEEVPRHGW